MDLGLQGKVAWIVGGSEGIGYSCVKSLIREGAEAVLSSRNAEKINRAVESAERETERKPLGIQADATNKQEMDAAFKQIKNIYDKVDILIYSAGISHHGTVMELEAQQWVDNWYFNVVSFVETVKLVVPEMKKQGGGRIIVVGASSGKQPTPNQLISNTTKGSLLPLVKSLSYELAPYQILINNICPGRFLTPRRWDLARIEEEHRNISPEKYFREVASTVPLQRLGDPDEAADLITFLVSSKASYITGQSLNVDGGLIRAII